MEHRMIGELFGSVLSIRQNTPYKASLSIADDESIVIDGDAVFRLDSDSLTFEFFTDQASMKADQDYYELVAEAQRSNRPIKLSIPDRTFESQVIRWPTKGSVTLWQGRLAHRSKLFGVVASQNLGSADEQLTSATALFKGLPKFSMGSLAHVQLTTESRVIIDGFSDEDMSHIGYEALGSFEISGQGWIVNFQEIHSSQLSDYGESHIAVISTSKDEEFNGNDLGEFLEDLSTFLGFTFGMPASPSLCIGRKPHRPDDSPGVWATLRPSSYKTQRMNNWFAHFDGQQEFNALFDTYMAAIDKQPSFRKYWRRLIAAYVDSQTAVDQLGNLSAALTVSMGAIESIVKLWLRCSLFDDARMKFIKLRPGQEIGQIKPGKLNGAIECVLDRLYVGEKRMMGGRDALKLIRQQRNLITHIDLDQELDTIDIYHCWNASQALFELLLLAMWGAKEVPLRTSVGKYEVMCVDMLKEARRGELSFE